MRPSRRALVSKSKEFGDHPGTLVTARRTHYKLRQLTKSLSNASPDIGVSSTGVSFDLFVSVFFFLSPVRNPLLTDRPLVGGMRGWLGRFGWFSLPWESTRFVIIVKSPEGTRLEGRMPLNMVDCGGELNTSKSGHGSNSGSASITCSRSHEQSNGHDRYPSPILD